MTKKDKIGSFFGAIDKAVNSWQNNKDSIESLINKGDEILTEEEDPFFESQVREDHVRIVADVAGEEISEIDINVSDGKAKIKAGSQDISVMVPDDTQMDVIEAFVNNGVLEVKMPRGEGEEE